jgi:predicted amidohydrolase YtcJ
MTLLRNVRLVAAAAVGGGVVDVRITDGVIAEIGPGLRPDAGALDIDADGRWAGPGLWDHHVHLRQWAQVGERLDVSGTASATEVTHIVGEHVARLGDRRPDDVVFGFGYRSATWPEPPTVADLDAVSGGHPVVLVSGDAHNGWLNSKALALFGAAPRDGALEEDDWFGIFARLGANEGESGYRAAVERAAAMGVVGVVDMELAAGFIEWPARIAAGIDQLRVRPAVYPDRLDDVVAAGLRTGDMLDGSRGLVTMGPLKIISDGSLNTRTAFCHEPYAGAASAAHPCGAPNLSPAELVALCERATAAGLEMAVHAIGDAAVGVALDAFEATGARGSIEHAQLIADGDAERTGRLGVIASVQPAHLLDDRDVTEHLWPDRSDRCFPLRSLLAAGVRLAFGSDAPVAPLDPWLAMAAAVHRSGDDREPWNPAQALTAAEAWAASTDGGDGRLTVGRPGDVVVLDDDPLRPHPDSRETAAHLRSMRVAATIVGGRPTHLEC